MKKKSSKKLKIALAIICPILVIAIVLSSIAVIRSKNIVQELDSITLKKDKMPSIDFIQPHLVLQEGWDYDVYFSELKAIGYDSVIVQMTRTEEADGSSTFYYDTSIADDGLIEKVTIHNILPEFIKQCEKNGFKFYIGLSVEEYSWWTLICYYDEDYMQHCVDVDCYMVKELWEICKNNNCFEGWYYAYELFSNPIGWEKLWANNVNAVIDAITSVDTNPTRPILFSPFRQIQLGLITNEYAMWDSFFARTNFRKGIDVFVPQDSIGKLDDTNNPHVACSNRSYKLVYDYVTQTAKVAEKYGIRYWVNCELFRAWKGESAHLFLGDAERVERQIKNAQRYAEKLVTFSGAHYLLSLGDQETQEARAAYYNDYKTLYESAK